MAIPLTDPILVLTRMVSAPMVRSVYHSIMSHPVDNPGHPIALMGNMTSGPLYTMMSMM